MGTQQTQILKDSLKNNRKKLQILKKIIAKLINEPA